MQCLMTENKMATWIKKQYNFSTKHAFVYIVSYCILSIILIIASIATVVRHIVYS